MDLVNKSVKNAIQFILCVQDSCDMHRKCMEHIWLQEYTSFVTEWKQKQSELRKQSEKNFESTSVKASKYIHKSPDNDLEQIEELALADSLLKKARHIRMKNQKLINGLVECKNISTPSADYDVHSKKSTNSSQTSEKNKTSKKMPQSKSDLAIKVYSHKNTVVPRSKSASMTLVPKEDANFCHKNKNGASLSAKFGAANHVKSPEKTTDALTVISSKDLDMLKRLHVNLPTCHELKPKKVMSHSDSSEDKNQHQISPHPSPRQFLNTVKGKLNAASFSIKIKLWYPFLSSKNEVFLTSVRCNTFCSIKKTCSILYSIQEIMMWIDLLYLMEREIYPTLVLDANDVNMLRICSYLLSIFHPTSQRLPILDPNG